MIYIIKHQIGVSGGKIIKTFKGDEQEIADEYFEDCQIEAQIAGKSKYYYEMSSEPVGKNPPL